MKLEDLLHPDFSIDDLEKITPQQLDELCKPFWPVTRPDPNRQAQQIADSKKKVEKKVKNLRPEEMSLKDKIEFAKQQARMLGIHLK